MRERSGVRVTDHGAKLLVHARTILAQVALAEAELTNRPSSPSGEVTLGIPSGATQLIVSKLLTAAREVAPLVSLKILEGMSGQIEEWMAHGRVDLAVSYRTLEGVGRALELAREEFSLITRSEDPPFADVIDLASLAPYPLVVPTLGNNVRKAVIDVSSRFGCNLNVRFEVDSLSAIVQMVLQGKAFSILTPSAVSREIRSGQLKHIRIVNPVISRSIVLLGHHRVDRSPAAKAIRRVLIEVVRGLVADGDWPAVLVGNGLDTSAATRDVHASIA